MTDSSRTVFPFRTIALVAILVGASASYAYAEINRSLDVGSTGADVSELQAFLAKDATLYPQGLVTGYYGFLTKAAISNFQSRNGIDAVGRVGPITRAALNAQMAGGMSGGSGGDNSAPIIMGAAAVNVGMTSASIIWNTNESARGIVYYSTTPLSLLENGSTVSVSGIATSTDTALRISQIVPMSGLQAKTTYYYLIHATDAAGNVNITWPTTFTTR
ncbi:MAG: peptidoglycan-binding protein [Minisyncoccia bacterium]